MVEIRGLEKFAPKDFPGQISSTVFVGGCNFRCPYCHNSDLVLNPETLPLIPLEFFNAYLDSRKGWLEAVCVSGGEPLLHQDLEGLLAIIKEKGLLVKVDTNGSFPSRLESIIRARLVDHIAMDVKAPLRRYPEVTGSDARGGDIAASIDLIRNSGLEYVFRTTVVPGLVEAEDILDICRMLSGSAVFQVQQFSPNNTLDKAYLQRKPYSPEEIQEFADMARPHFTEVRIEGV